MVIRAKPVRLSTRWAWSPLGRIGSKRSYIHGGGMPADPDALVLIWQNLNLQISDAVLSDIWLLQSFDIIPPPVQSNAQLSEGLVLVFRVDDQDNQRYISYHIPGASRAELFQANGIICNLTHPAVDALIAFILAYFGTPSGEPLAECVGGYLATFRFENQ